MLIRQAMEHIKKTGAVIIALLSATALSYSQGPARSELDSLKMKVMTSASTEAIAESVKNESLEQLAEDKPKVTLSGYIDSYILHAFNNPKSGTLMGNPSVYGGAPVGRAFDRLNDQFSLGLVQTK